MPHSDSTTICSKQNYGRLLCTFGMIAGYACTRINCVKTCHVTGSSFMLAGCQRAKLRALWALPQRTNTGSLVPLQEYVRSRHARHDTPVS